MNKYETLYIINPKLDGEATKAVIEKFANLVTENGGVVDGIEEQGIKKLAYEINFVNEGFYVLMNFTANATLPAELERNFKISEDIMRFIVIKKEA
ncbi:MAG: 30S ribosomal protein S6 [Clostridia bacterium]|nr:30S ribosomal protein S6 [Clostridia bacterium]